MNEIGGTFKWSHKQIQAYARAFREGDAVKVKDNWHEVVRKEDVGIRSDVVHTIPIVSTVTTEDNSYNLNRVYDKEGNFGGITKGFLKSHVKSPYNIITPKDYDVQEGDKLIWLGEGYSHWVFGRSYTVEADSCGRLVAFDEDGLERLPKSENWVVIPRYENVKEEKDMDDKNEHSENTRTFKVGDRVRVVGAVRVYEGHEGAVGIFDDTGGEPSCAVVFDDGRGKWFESEFLELVKEEEKSPEQEALEYLLSQSKDETRNMLEREVALWAEVNLAHRKHGDLRQATDILEKLEKCERD